MKKQQNEKPDNATFCFVCTLNIVPADTIAVDHSSQDHNADEQ